MSPELSLPDLLSRLRQGDAEAARQLFERFAHRLIGLARSHLDRRLRGKVDPEDVMQSVFMSFFRMQREQALAFGEWDDLWSLLAVITLRKCGHRAAYYLAACRDVRREFMSFANDDEAETGWEAIAREPTPLEATMLGETVAEMLRSLDGRDRELATLALQGYTRMEIADQVGCTERTVYRVLERLRRHLARATVGTP